jgi:hypothetical protein
MLVSRCGRVLLPLVVMSMTPAAALAAPTPKERGGAAKAACVAAHEQAQSLRTQKKPHAAREKFVACARSECPVVLRKECAEQLEQIESTAPTVVLEAIDDTGASDSNVKVTSDGQPLADRLTGSAIAVEPGEHVFRFERASDGKAIEQRVLVGEGEKNRKLVADFQTLLPRRATPVEAPREAPARPAEPKRIPLLAYLAAGVGVVGLGSFTFFSLTGKSTEDELASTCAPSCAADRISSVERSYLIADISLAVGIIGVVTAVVLALPAITSPRPAARASAPWRPRLDERSWGPRVSLPR